MRLNQLAKKVGKPYTRVEKYIRKDLNIEGIEGPNARVDDNVIARVVQKFGLASEEQSEMPKVKLETVEAKPAEIAPEERGIDDVELEVATPAEAVVPNLDGLGEVNDDEETEQNEEVVEVVAEQAEEALVEVVESKIEKKVTTTVETEETILHFDEEGTIVAPKVELEGIKVRGKIDIPGVTDVVKEQEEVVELTPEQEAELKAKEEAKEEERRKKEEERRKRIDAEAAKAAEYKAKKEKERQEALRAKIEEEKKKKREEGKKHYLNQVKQSPKGVSVKKKKSKVSIEAEENKAFETKEKYTQTENLTTWQKIVKWFNT